MRRLASVFKRRSAKAPDVVLSKNALVPPLPVPPFEQHDVPFPRSVNPPALLPPPSNIRVTMLRTHLVAQLDNSFVYHPPSPSFPDVSYPTNPSKISPASPGVRRWIARPCFEERYVVYLPSPSGVDIRPVSAAALAVAALEFSEHLDAMADPDFDHHTYPEYSPAPSSRNSYTPAPSPLRNEHNPDPSPTPQATASKSHVKRVVRFAEDDSDGDDTVPLHILRMRKMREQKAAFLKQEHLRRTTEEAEERRGREQDARRLEDEALQREHRRQMLEKEKREREKLLYAETVAATRLRRESHRVGALVSSNTINLLVPSSPSFTSLRDSERNNPPPDSKRLFRLPHDPPASLSIPRRQPSDSALPVIHSRYPSDSSPSSSRPPSMSHSPSPVSPEGHGHHSRPPSTHSANTSSSEEIRHQGKRTSLTAAAVAAHTTSSGSAFGRSPMIASYPAWSGSNPNLQYIPPVPPLPDFVHDMPLLPPTAPFMKHSFNPRFPSRNGSPGPSSSSSSRRGSSTERVNQIPPSLSRNSSAQSLSPNPALSSSVKPTMHQRRGSGDSRNTHSTRSRQVSRGRPSQPIRSSTQYPPGPPPSTWIPFQNLPMQSTPTMTMVPAMVPVYPMNMNMHTNTNGIMQQSNPRSGTSGTGGGSTSSKPASRGWRQTQAIIS